ncbi:MAG: laminin B domain-containing protein [Planctomycetota bacterium]
MRHTFAIVALSLVTSSTFAQPMSTFGTDAEDWRAIDDANAIRSTQWVAAGGSPGGYIERDDFGSGSYFFLAPSAFLGDLSSFVGGQLQFALRSVGDADLSTQTDDIVIIGSAGRINLDVPTSRNPGPSWTSFSIGLSDMEPWVYDGPLSNLSQNELIGAVLTDVTELRIRGDWREGPDTGSLDTVSLVAGNCNPADLALPFGLLDLADIDAFIAAFVAEDALADIVAPFGVIDLGDIDAFIASFLGGCP